MVSKEVNQDRIDRINDEGRGLDSWELSFMESVTDQFERFGKLSEKQEEIIERIYVNKVP